MKNFFGRGELYQDYNNVNIIKKLRRALGRGAARWTDDGKKLEFPTHVISETPWFHVKMDGFRECYFGLHICFNEMNIISRNCFNCWKVVVRPRTVEELFKLLDLEFEYARKYDKGHIPGAINIEYTEVWMLMANYWPMIRFNLCLQRMV